MASSTTILGLEQIRRKSGVSLEQISESTKISTFFLRAIESEEFEKLPGGIFNTNYIRQYAQAIGFAENKVLQLHQEFQVAKERQENATETITPQRGIGGRLLNWLLAPSERSS